MNETLTIYKIISAALILAGVFLAGMKNEGKREKVPGDLVV